MIPIIIFSIATVCVIALAIWQKVDPHRCICGVPEWLQFGMYIEHANNCPARKGAK